MPGVTVGEVLRLALPAGSRVVGGASGLGREIGWALVLRPEALSFEELAGGELVLLASTAPDVFLGEAWLLQLLDGLNAEMVAAVAVAGQMPIEVAGLADRLGIPVISLPDGAALHDVERSVLGAVLNHRAQLEQRGVQIYRQLAQMVTLDRGISAIVETLHQITGKSIVYQDDRLSVQLWAAAPDILSTRAAIEAAVKEKEWVHAWLEGAVLVSTAPPIGRQDLPSLGMARFIAPIIVKDAVAGYISILGGETELTELDRVAAGRAASVCAMELAKQRAVVETEQRVRGDFLGDLLEGRLADRETILSRARMLGYSLDTPNLVASFGILPPRSGSGWSAEREGDDRLSLLRALEVVVAEDLSRSGLRCLVGIRGRAVAVLCGVPEGSQRALREAIEKTRLRAAERLGRARVAAGVSRVCASLFELPRAAAEASQALSIAQRLFAGERGLWFEELGVYRLLLPLKESSQLSAFADEYLSRLVAYDQKHGGELVRTLEAFFASCGNYSRASEQLALHRNTLSYRLHRIEELTGLSLDDAENRLCLQLALKIREVG